MRLLSRRYCVCASAAVAICCLAGELSGQGRLDVAAGAVGVVTRVTPEDPQVRGQLTGVLLGGEGRVEIGRFSANVRYMEGSVKSTRLDVSQDLVEGEFLIGVSPIDWLTLKLGPHVRSFTFADGTRRRWFYWEGRVRGTARLFDQQLRSYVEVWKALSADVSGADPFDYGQGAEGGLELRLATSPLWARLGYRVQRSRLQNVRRPQTIEQILLGFGVTRN